MNNDGDYPTKVGSILGKDFSEYSFLKENIDNIDNKNINNNIDNGKFAFKENFIPQTEETYVAYEIAKALNDLDNYALFRSVVKKLGAARSTQLLKVTQDDIAQGEKIGKPIKNPAALFNWKAKKIYNG